MDSDFKQKVVAHLNALLHSKIEVVRQQISEITEALEAETKSTVGDKHETARAKLQSQQDTLEGQLEEYKRQLGELKRAIMPGDHSVVHNGSLIGTNRGWFLLLAPVGKIDVESLTIFAISSLSPIGRLFIGLRAGQGFSFNGLDYLVKEIL